MLWRTSGAVLFEHGSYHFADKPTKEPVRPKKFLATFEVHEYALSNSEYSYQQVQDAQDDGPSTKIGQPRAGATRRVLGGGCRTLKTCWCSDLHLPVFVVQVKEKARQLIQPSFKASDGWAIQASSFVRAKTSLSRRLPT